MQRGGQNAPPFAFEGTRARRKPSFALRTPTTPEHPIQEQIARLLTIEIAAPGRVSVAGVCWWAIDMAGYTGKVPGTRMGRGCIAGIPDLFILYRGRAHHIEIKTTEGELSEDQRKVGAGILIGGGRLGVARSAEEILALIDEWAIPRARRVRVAA